MAPMLQNKSAKDQKIKALLSFARSLPARLENDIYSTSIRNDLHKHVTSVPLNVSVVSATQQQDLDSMGTELWNLSTRMHREGMSTEKDKQRTLCLLRVFAFLLLDYGQQTTKSRSMGNNAVRVLKVALKASKFCIEAGELELSLKALERAADYVNASEKADDPMCEQGNVPAKLRVEYYAIRIALAWKQSRLDLAESMFSKGGHPVGSLDPGAAESFADLLLEIGKDCLCRKQYDLAVRWLERSHDVLSAQDVDQLSADSVELRLSILQSLVKALHTLNENDSRRRAWDLLRLMESDFTDKMVVLLLKLEMMSTERSPDTATYSSTLLRMVPSLVITDTNFKTLMHHIHYLKSKDDTKSACTVLDELILQRLCEPDRHKYLEKACVTRIWVDSQTPDSDEHFASFSVFLDLIRNNLQQPFSAIATHAAQTLLWRKIETSYSQQRYESSRTWCNMSLHNLFENAGEMNKAKISRKMILCSLAIQDYADARRTFFTMTETGKLAGITQYLMYKVALRSNQEEQAIECLEAVSKASNKDATILYACILEAQKAGDKRQATMALQKVVERYNYNVPEGVHLAILLRCAIRLLIKQFETEEDLDKQAVKALLSLFEGALKAAKEASKKPNKTSASDFTVTELEWFSKSSYNLALKYCARMSPEHLGQLLLVCVQFVEFLEAKCAEKSERGLLLRKIFCHYLATTAYLTVARSHDNSEQSLNNYLSVRKHGKIFRELVYTQLSAVSELAPTARDDLVAKHTQVLTYELEALLKLADWSSIDELLDSAFTFDVSSHLATLADLILLIHSTLVTDLALSHSEAGRTHQSHVLKSLQKVINAAWKASSSTTDPSTEDITKLARWIRCLFQIAVNIDEKVSLQCLDQATRTAERLKAHGNVYPKVELEWLATTAFNRGVDAYCAGDDEACQLWAVKAMALARTGDENEEKNGLLRTLLGNYSRLQWDRVDQ
ncbi:SPO22-domain-containing protein [Pseudovirgaria hyperparasitica]|uniref:SPO22-domain-containing protein n=1 Tax=Pseudovirgaria hyperparasitica TaxID=470096 RepID=A0A6A6WJS9_9PEZI|nr:SPO22-domain-containing protein [Pseudovirgaria hyperparasitica]KAF2762127.1 SPO22-domain-containing protein [Pseudovirgaria hyperparasitica]